MAQVAPAPEGLSVPDQQSMTGYVAGANPEGYTPAKPGISKEAQKNSIEPGLGFQHDLLPGETILSTYDVHMPSDMMPAWQFWLYTCLTFGLFYVYYHMYYWCLRKGYCTLPVISMARGKMAITSTKRVLIWKTNFNQVRTGKYPFILKLCCSKELCADPVDFTSKSYSRTYSINMINDVELRLNQQMSILMGVACCSETYGSSIRLRFGEFKQDSLANMAFALLPTQLYKSTCASTFASSSVDLFALAYSLMNMMLSTPEDLNWVDIVSERFNDFEYDLENPKFDNSYPRLTEIARQINGMITEKRSAVWKVPSNQEGLFPPHEPNGGEDVAWAEQDIVRQDSCAAPQKYVPLSPGEEIIATSADMYKITFMDKLIIFINVLLFVVFAVIAGISGGMALIFAPVLLRLLLGAFNKLLEIRAKLQSRNGFILTTMRLVNIQIWRKDTIFSLCCPSSILCCFPTQQEANIRSIYPRSVESGLISRKKQVLTGLLLTNAGAVQMTFDLSHLKAAADVMKADTLINKRLAFLKACASVHTRGKVVDSSQVQSTFDFKDGMEKKVFPMINDERVLSRYTGKIYDDSCVQTCGPSGICAPLEGCCTNRRTWHPAACIALTCGVKPHFSETSVIISDSTVYAARTDTNEPHGPCCAPGGFCHVYNKVDDWSIYWTPLNALAGSEVWSVLYGHETFWTRCCEGKWLGKNCCPLLRSEAKASLVLTDKASPACVTIQAKEVSQFEAIRDSEDLIKFRQGVAHVQGLMTSQGVNTMS